MSTLGLSNLQSNGGVTTIPILNVNALYVGGVLYDSAQEPQDVAGLQAQINQINNEIAQIEAITNRIDFTQAPLLVGDLVITEDNKNSVLLTAIQNLQQSIGQINKLDLTALPAAPPASCVITPTTTNQALKALIDGHDADIAKFDLTAMPAAPPASIVITPTTTNQALKTLIDTNTNNITTIQGQITTINTSITNINTKIAHWNNFTLNSDSMCGVNDGTGFAVALSNDANGNGIFVYPNSTSSTAQIQLATAYDKEILIRGGDAVKIYGGNDGSITSRNRVELGDKTDVIAIGVNNGGLIDFPEVEIGVDGTLGVTRDSSTTIKGDLYFSRQVSSTGLYNIPPYTPVLVADTSPTADFGNCNKFTTDPTFSGLDVLATAGIAPITLTAGAGAIPITAALGLISLTALAGGITLATGAGIMTLNCGAGGFLLNSGAGVMNFASGSGNINSTTISGDIVLGAGKAVGGSSGNTILNSINKVTIQPDVETEIYKASFLELNDNAGQPAVTANRLYQQADALYWNGQLVQGGSGNQYVLKTGDTMTGALTTTEVIAPIITLDNLTTAPTPITNRLYQLNNVLTFNGVAVGAGSYLPLTGGTLTGQLIINYDAGQVTPQLQITNTNNNAPVGGQGAAINLRNDSAGNGSIGERCGKIDFAGKDSVGGGGRTYAAIQGYINDPTSTAIDGRLSSYVASNNTLTEMTRLISTSTGLRQANIAAAYTTIGSSALGSTATSTLTIQGTTNSTTSLQTPQIYNCPAIYSETSSTLTDGAVRQYRPERVYKLDDYPSPLSAPTIDGEKVFILNKAGNPSGLDQIWANADFPTYSGATLTQVIQAKYVDKTNFTPAANYVTTLYSDNVCRVFVQADIAGSPLTMTLVCSCVKSSGNTGICDFLVTSYSTQHRLYFGGAFNSVTLISGGVVAATNFSGQITMFWTSSAISSQTHTPMISNATAQDGGANLWSGVEGVNDIVNCIVDMTGNTIGFTQPTPQTGKYDSIVIGGNFTGISTNPYRALQRIAYYDYNYSSGNPTALYSPTGLLPNQTSYFYSQLSGQALAGAPNGDPVTKTYINITITATIEFLGAGAAPAPQFATCVGIIKDYNGNLFATGTSQNITATGSQQLYTFDIPNVTLQGGTLGQGYDYYIQVTNINDLPANSVTYLADNLGNLISTGTGFLTTGNIGWRTFASADWSTPVGANDQVRGAIGFSDGYIGFAYSGTQITAAPQTIQQHNYYFSMYYAAGTATFGSLNSDTDAIETGAAIIGELNCMTGGNPVYTYGAGNAIAYGYGYLNRFTNNAGVTGISFRYSAGGAYAVANALTIINAQTLSAEQLIPQFGNAENCSAVYRDDTKFPNVLFLALNTETKTATSPWTQGSAPNYDSISLSGGVNLPSVGFGGYSDETGYQGLVIYGQAPANGYLYKGGQAGELVVDLSGCVVRTSGDNGAPVIASNKLTFPADEDGTSIMLLGDTQLVNGKPSWWAVSQDGIVTFDNTPINSRGNAGAGGITSVTATGDGITATTANNAVTIANTGVTSIVAGTNVTISGATGAVTINAAAAQGVTSLEMFPYVTGNQQNIVISPFQTTTGALQIVNQPTKVGFFAEFSGFGEYGQLHIANGQSIFAGTSGADANGFIPATPVQFFGNIIPTYYSNTSKKVKFTCSISFNDIGGGFISGNHYMYLAAGFYKNIQPTPAFAQPMMQTSGVACYGTGSPITNLYRIGASWTDMFSLEANNSQSNQILLCNQFYITAYTDYPIANTTGYMFWEIEYVTDP